MSFWERRFSACAPWNKPGRKSIDAVAIFGGLPGMGGAGSTAIAELLPRLKRRRAPDLPE